MRSALFEAIASRPNTWPRLSAMRYRLHGRVGLVYLRSRRRATPAIRWHVAHRQRFKCNMCKETLPSAPQLDHITPWAAGGPCVAANYQMLCANCHAAKTQAEQMVPL